jgi:hypothetical protein
MEPFKGFGDFLLNEGRVYLANKIGDILTALQNLSEDAQGGLGRRACERGVQKVVDQIRRVLHSHWDDTEKNALEVLQTVAVGLMVGLEKTEVDLPSLMASAVESIQDISSKLEEPLNNLGSESDQDPDEDDDGDLGVSGEIGID